MRKNMKNFVIKSNEEGQTIYKFVKRQLEGAPLSFIEKLFRIKDVKVNKKRVNKTYLLSSGDLVEIYINEQQINDFSIGDNQGKYKLSIKPVVVYEDDNILIVNKPAGILVHGDKNEKRITLTNMVLSYLYNKGEYDFNNKGFTPALAHRIDRNTSGLVVFGKNIKALQALENIFKEHNKIHKFYYALVKGITPNKGVINKPLYKDEENSIVKVSSLEAGAKSAITRYSLIEKYSYCSLIEAEILTGRTHQIRAHFASINHPLLGDEKYGDFDLNKKFFKEYNYRGQFLHAHKIKFDLIDGYLSYLSKKEFECPFNQKEQDILKKLKTY